MQANVVITGAVCNEILPLAELPFSDPVKIAVTASGSHTDSDKKNCSRCTAGSLDPVTGSAPASAVSVLFRSRGASSPAWYSRNPRRCAT